MSYPAPRVSIVAADFNKELVSGMIDAAQNELAQAGAVPVRLYRVAGAYEIPLIADLELAKDDVDALIVLGYIERGETLHGEVMGHVVHRTLVDLQLDYHKPVGIGIIGPGATPEQAKTRWRDYACSAVKAALQSHALMRGE